MSLVLRREAVLTGFTSVQHPSDVFPLSPPCERTVYPRLLKAILRAVDQLLKISPRLEALPEHYPPVSAALITIAGTVRNAAVLKVVFATRGPKPI